MDKENEICIVLNNLVHGIDYESGAFNFSDKVDSSLKVISAALNNDDKVITLKNDNLDEVTEYLKVLKTLIYTSFNADEILSYGNEHLPHLKISVKNNNDSSENDKRLLLKDLSKKFKAIQIFSDEIEDTKYMEYKEEFQKSIDKFYEINETLDGLEIINVIKKEIRELIIKKDSSISSSKAKQEKSVADGINALNENRPICTKCNKEKMVIREGNGSYFWGCPTYPDCWGRKWFNKKELQILGKS